MDSRSRLAVIVLTNCGKVGEISDNSFCECIGEGHKEQCQEGYQDNGVMASLRDQHTELPL